MDKALEKQITDLEMQFWRAMKDKDAGAATRLTGETCILTGAQGASRIEGKMFADLLKGATWTLHDFQMENMQARMISDDVAIVAYKVKENLTVDGKPLTLVASDSSTWVRRDGSWKCALHTEAVAGDPFGRDRTPMPAARAD